MDEGDELKRIARRLSSFYWREQWEEMLTLAREVAERFPSQPFGYLQQGTALVKMERFAEAVPALEKALERTAEQEERASALYWMSNALEGAGRLWEALAAIEGAIEVKPQSGAFWGQKAMVLEEMGRFEEAARAMSKECELDAHYAGCHRHRAKILLELGRLKEAFRDADRAFRLQPENHANWEVREEIRQNLGEQEGTEIPSDADIRKVTRQKLEEREGTETP